MMRVVQLDILRFIAAISVVLYHYIAWFFSDNSQHSTVLIYLENYTRYGYLGVPLFFMISGFVILASAKNRSFINFSISRALRLYPVYWLSFSLTTVFIFYSQIPSVNDIDLQTYLVN
jgi:peptidoglycan/LPS O-acetylase OafA/YrhL